MFLPRFDTLISCLFRWHITFFNTHLRLFLWFMEFSSILISCFPDPNRHPFFFGWNAQNIIGFYTFSIKFQFETYLFGRLFLYRKMRCIHTYNHTYMHMCIRTYVHTYVHQYMQAHTYASINKYLHIYMAQSTPTNNHACRCIDKISTASLKHIKNHWWLIHFTPTWLIALSLSFVCCLWRANRPKLSYSQWTSVCPTLLIIISSCCVCCLTGPLLFIMIRGI